MPSRRLTFRKEQKKTEALWNVVRSHLGEIPDSDGGDLLSPANIRIGILADPFVFSYYKDAAAFVYLTRENYKEELLTCEFFLYVTHWEGLHRDWMLFETFGETEAVFDYANQIGKPSVFHSIEDYVHYELFLPLARKADYIFTGCEEVIDRYKADTGNHRVFLLENGVNPALHNPLGYEVKDRYQGEYDTDTIFFAGGYHRNFANRTRDIDLVFDGFLAAMQPFLIADRYFGEPDKQMPDRFVPYTMPPIEHRFHYKVHKMFHYSLCFNSIQDSRTMCAMRVHELQALGCLILSNDSFAIRDHFPEIFIVNDGREAAEIVRSLTQTEKKTFMQASVRRVMTDRTVFDRMAYIFDEIGAGDLYIPKKIILLCDEFGDQTMADFKKQKGAKSRFFSIELSRKCDAKMGDISIEFSEALRNSEYGLIDTLNRLKYSRLPIGNSAII